MNSLDRVLQNYFCFEDGFFFTEIEKKFNASFTSTSSNSFSLHRRTHYEFHLLQRLCTQYSVKISG